MLAVIKDKLIVMVISEEHKICLPNGIILEKGEPGWTDGEYIIGKINFKDPDGKLAATSLERELIAHQLLMKDEVSLDENNIVVHHFSFFPYVDKVTLLENFKQYNVTEEDILKVFETHPDKKIRISSAAYWKIGKWFGQCPLMTGVTDFLGLSREEMETLFEKKPGT